MTERNDTPSRLRALFADYLETAAELEADRRPTDVLQWLRGGRADDPCHERFAAEAEKLLKECTAASPSSEEAAAILAYLFEAPAPHRGSGSAYWMLLAVQGLGMDLIDRLDKADAAALRERFVARYPRRERLPVQDRILKKLKLQAK